MMSTHPQVVTYSKNWNWRRNGSAERRRRRIQARSAESFPLSHGRNLHPERVSGRQPDHEILRDIATLRGVECTGAPAYTGPREVSNNAIYVRNGHHHYNGINYQMSANSQTAPPHVNHEDQQVSLRSHLWNGSEPWRKEDSRWITPGRWIANENYPPTRGYTSEQQIRTGYPQPISHSYHKGSIQTADWIRAGRTDTTKDNINGRVVPPRTEKFEDPIRYTNSVNHGNPHNGVTGRVIHQHLGQHDQQKSLQCVPMGLGNPWGHERHSRDKYIMKENWNPLDNYAGFANVNDGSVTNSADNHLSNRVANAKEFHSNQTNIRHNAKDHGLQEPTTCLDELSRGNVAERDPDQTWKGQCDLVKEVIRPIVAVTKTCLLYTSPSPRDRTRSRMPSSA